LFIINAKTDGREEKSSFCERRSSDLELITGFEPHKCNNYKMKTTISEIFSFVFVFALQGNTFSISVFIQIYLTFCFCLLRKVIWIFVFLWQVLTIFIFKSSLKNIGYFVFSLSFLIVVQCHKWNPNFLISRHATDRKHPLKRKIKKFLSVLGGKKLVFQI